ncbi:hypothetical protein [Bradyrhizobium liaoningense]|nr:hypothetical protein [Bradyrhizobium liaoningense]MBR0907174.1 hypothetical protein [Bradyrhizobium liaoningense]
MSLVPPSARRFGLRRGGAGPAVCDGMITALFRALGAAPACERPRAA